MVMTIDLSDEQQATLAAQAQAQGVSPEEYIRRALAHVLQPTRPRHIAELIRDNMRDLQPEDVTGMPTDGASQNDHYIYGLPKRDM